MCQLTASNVSIKVSEDIGEIVTAKGLAVEEQHVDE